MTLYSRPIKGSQVINPKKWWCNWVQPNRPYWIQVAPACYPSQKSDGASGFSQTGLLSFHCQEWEVIAALWNQPHALPSLVRNHCTPGTGLLSFPKKVAPACYPSQKSDGAIGFSQTGLLSFHCQKWEVIAALWNQPHALPSLVRNRCTPGLCWSPLVHLFAWNGRASIRATQGSDQLGWANVPSLQCPHLGYKLALPSLTIC